MPCLHAHKVGVAEEKRTAIHTRIMLESRGRLLLTSETPRANRTQHQTRDPGPNNKHARRAPEINHGTEGNSDIVRVDT